MFERVRGHCVLEVGPPSALELVAACLRLDAWSASPVKTAVDGRSTPAEHPGNFGDVVLAALVHGPRRTQLVRRPDRWPTTGSTSSSSSGESSQGSLADQVSLELGQAPKR